MVDPKEVDATIGYLSVTTPHKFALAEHYWENSFVVWHKKIRKRMLSGSMKEPYYLLIAYHGFWFIPQFVVNFLYRQFKKKRRWELYVFSYLLEKLLVLRNYTLSQYFLITITRFKQKGFVFVIKKIFSKAQSKFFTKSIINKSLLDQVLYRSKSP